MTPQEYVEILWAVSQSAWQRVHEKRSPLISS